MGYGGMELQQLPNLLQRESQLLAPLDKHYVVEVPAIIISIAGRRSLRVAQQFPAFVEPDGLNTDSRFAGEFPNTHTGHYAMPQANVAIGFAG